MSYFGIPIRNGLPIGLGSVAPLASGGGSPFSPLSLFSGGAPGAWYDPSDYGATGTLFQDSAGTTPVTAVEQPVGLMLDKSQGLVLGSELITPEANRDFSSDTGYWAKGGATAVIASGVCTITNLGQISKTLLLTIGKTYNITYDLAVRGGSVYIQGYFTATNATTSGAKSFILTATSGTLTIVGNGGATDVDLDNISVKELPGNHAFQATSASRPVLSARYNQATYSEDISNAAWAKNGLLSIAGNLMTEATTTAGHRIEQTSTVVSGAAYVFSFEAKRNGRDIQAFLDGTAFGTNAWVNFDLASGALGTKGAAATGMIIDRGDGYYLCTVTATAIATGATTYYLALANSSSAARNPSYTGDGTSGAYATKIDFRSANNGITQPAYQRVNTATDYATTGFLPYLKFDGVDDSLSTNSISFTSTDKMSVFAGVRKLSDVQFQHVVELSPHSSINAGAFVVAAPDVTATYLFRSNGSLTPSSALSAASFAAPITNTLTGLGDISGDLATLRVNGTQVAQSTADQGTGNFGNYPLFIGRRNNASLPFSGHLYSLIIVGKAVTAGELSSTETYVNQKTGAY